MLNRFPRRVYGAIAALAFSAVAPANAAPPVEAFAQLPYMTDVDIAPDGGHLTARVNIDGDYYSTIFKYEDEALKPVKTFSEGDTDVMWLEWVNEKRLLVALEFAANRFGTATTETRLAAVNLEKKYKVKELFRTRDGEIPVQIQTDVVSLLPNDPEHFLLQYYNNNDNPGVYRVNVDSHRHKMVQSPKKGVYDWIADHDGEVRLGTGTRDEKEPFMVVKLKGEKKWTDMSHRLRQNNHEFSPLAFSAKPNTLLVASDHEGGPSALYTFDLEKDEFGKKIYQHETSEVMSVILQPKTGLLRGVVYYKDEPEVYWFDDSRKALEQMFSKALGGLSVKVAATSPDESYVVFRAYEKNQPFSYYLYDKKAKRIGMLADTYPDLKDVPLGQTFSTSYMARDGLEIPAYVTLPPGYKALSEAQELPFVLMPHGGPHARDFLFFDWWAQLLASRGYGVLQMNFRGSVGYGQEFKDAGKKEWGEAMQDDITDGAQWLVNENYADMDRLAIVGGSYGGYAALMGAVKTPDLYQCAVSFAGVSDLPDLLRHFNQYIAGKYSTRHIGNLWKDREKLKTNSPARRADEIKIPVLLVHGDDDRSVPVAQTRKMARALKRNDKNHKYIEFKDGDHFLSGSEDRLRFAKEMESFLQGCIGQAG